MSIVSVSLFAGAPHFGHVVLTNDADFLRGFSPTVNSISIGSVIGNSLSGTGTTPHFSQCTKGRGLPQYLCLDISQSLSLY